ncbi:hypothetical protein [Agriterribacter sp.]|uniref:hypothetical protein n=1 Tax=Agriterribacter sp. TaxID=2821509 RepID=UPI002CFCE11B|nr:hypothetical protein [Agriterribacter sp.]HRP57441.1 hypothetical protein [Agriterribacter sp.]
MDVLQLEQANDKGQLRIIYKHCTLEGAGTGRTIVLKDEKGSTLKKWTFTNAGGSDLSMSIPVSELLQLEKNNAGHDLSLRYTARELPKGETLAFLRVK